MLMKRKIITKSAGNLHDSDHTYMCADAHNGPCEPVGDVLLVMARVGCLLADKDILTERASQPLQH